MKFARYQIGSETAYGVVEGETIKRLSGAPFTRAHFTGQQERLSEVKLLAPCQPTKMLAMALNYKSHLGTAEPPKKPEPFWKALNSAAGPGDTIRLPADAGLVEEEAELVVVIGRTCQRVSREEALACVFGYTCGNDVSARVWQRGDMQWWRAKSSDTFAPFGPFIVNELDGSKLDIRARVNGKEVQHCNTSELLYDIPTLVSFISQCVTLEPGDLIYTGTSGKPGEIRDGDSVEIDIPGIGVLQNPVKAVK